jgi:bla regulator protein BlaR1
MILNHLWQSSLFVAVVWILTLALAKNRAAVRYWLWLAASVKFLIPFSLLVSVCSQFGWRTAAPVMNQPQVSFVMEEIGRASSAPVAVAVASPGFNFVPALMGIWFCGFVVGVVCWIRWWLRIRAALRAGRWNRLPHLVFGVSQEDRSLWSRLVRAKRAGREPAPLPIRISSTRMEPGVFGIFRPVLLLPEGIMDRLTPAQLEAILAHELCHVRRRDNLTAAIHMVVETIFWFHPLVWWIRARLIDERERACDEEVLRMGNAAEVYAESILEACKLYLESPLACVSGVTGSNLKRRIETIMANRHSVRVNFSKKLLLGVAAIAAVIGPVAIGVMNAPAGRAQSRSAARLEFEVASVKPHKPEAGPLRVSSSVENGRLNYINVTLKNCIRQAYGLRPYQISGGPGWLTDDRYDVIAKAAGPASKAQIMLMLQTLLADRFKLTYHFETREMPVYTLAIAKSGLKIKEAKDDGNGMEIGGDPQHPFSARNVSMALFAGTLSRLQELDRPVVDGTGLKGIFNFTLDYAPDEAPSSDNAGPSIFTALTEQLGLRLDSSKGPVEILVIDHVERPTGNDQAFFKNALWTPPQTFEVASIKSAPPGATERGVTHTPGGRLSTSNATMKQLVYLAYRVMPFQVSGGPDWVGSDGFNIEAKPAEATADMERFRQMIKALLADRFHLKFHMETKQLPVYELVVGKHGPKLIEDKSDNLEVGVRNLGGEVQGAKATMPMLASALTKVLGRQVLDETGLKGAYTFKLQFLPDQKLPGPDDDGARANNDGASLFTAIQEQLGLSLKASKGPVEVLVIDSAEKPSGN